MSNQQQIPTETLFQELDKLINEDEFEQAITIANKILSRENNDKDAFLCKLLCMIKLSQIEQAKALIRSSSNPSDYAFELAYCHYRGKDFPEALELLSALPRSTKVMELEAQVLYVTESYAQSIARYEELAKKYQGDQAKLKEIKTNLLAAYTEAGRGSDAIATVAKDKQSMQKTYEMGYNAACAMISVGDLDAAESSLKVSMQACTEAMKEDEAEEEDILDEVAPMLVQQGFCQQKRGNTAAAMELYSQVLKSHTKDTTAGAIASNNIAAIKKKHDLFDSEKKLKAASGDTVFQKLTANQRRAINFNKSLLYLYMNKPEEARKQIESIKSSPSFKPAEAEGLDLVLAALLLKEKRLKEAEDMIGRLTKAGASLKSHLSLAQVYVDQGDLDRTYAALADVSTDERYCPALLATRIAILERTGKIDEAATLLEKAIEWYEARDDTEARYLTLVKESGTFLLRHQKYPEAAAMFERLLKRNRNDMFALPSLIIAKSHCDPEMAEKLEARLPPISDQDKIDAEALENMPRAPMAQPKIEEPATPPTATASSSAKGSAGKKSQQKGKGKENKNSNSKAADEEKKKTKKKRKPRLPKNYDPNIKPDPERWLPKQERSSYKPKKNQKKGDQLGKGSQGSIPGAKDIIGVPKGGSSSSNQSSSSRPPPEMKQKKMNAKRKKGKK